MPRSLRRHPSHEVKFSPSSLGAMPRQIKATMAIITMKEMASMIPGMSPAMYRRPTDSSTKTP